MNDDRTSDAAARAKGSVKEAIGKLTGDAKAQAEGAAEKAGDRAQGPAGKAKDGLRKASAT